ncbi:condensation domain-containing protein [Streptomyces sp. NPDC101213]|uniref:condensation domain-containing protein n=1 Tax=Streptomyces sp. NPDC101213 TaxID=3366130 RepID=UPI00382535A3
MSDNEPASLVEQQPPPERTGPLTHVQRLWLPEEPDRQVGSHEDNQFRELRLATAMGLDDVRRAVRGVLGRHEVLRSRIVGRGDTAYQAVDAVDPGWEKVLVASALDGWDDAVAAARRTTFRLSSQWPLILLTGIEEGKVSRIAVVVDHWAADGLGVVVLLDDLTAALQAQAEDGCWTPAGAVEQPVDLALWESATPAGALQSERALAYWRQQYERLARGLCGHGAVPPTASSSDAAPRLFPGCTLTSVRVAEAAAVVADRMRVQPAVVYLAAFSDAIGAAEGVDLVGTLMLSANRLTSAAMRSVRNAVMSAPVVLDVTRPGHFAETVERAAVQQVRAFRHANADHRLTGGIAEEVLGDLRDSAVTSAIFNFMPESALRGDRPPAIVRDAACDVVEPMPPRTTAARRMFMASTRQDRVTMTLRWREDTSWQRYGAPMMRYIADLIVNEAAREPAPAVFGHAQGPR